MNYSDDSSSVRCDQFRLSGKWYQTFALDMSEVPWRGDEISLDSAVRESLRLWREKHGTVEHKKLGCLQKDATEGFFVILEPHHEHGHPQVVWY